MVRLDRNDRPLSAYPDLIGSSCERLSLVGIGPRGFQTVRPEGVLPMTALAIGERSWRCLKPEHTATKRKVWNAGRTVGAKRALKPKQIWEIRFYLNQRRRLRDRALFDLAIDSKLRGCDLVQMKISDLVSGGQIRTRAIVMQQKTSYVRLVRHCYGGLEAIEKGSVLLCARKRAVAVRLSRKAHMAGHLQRARNDV